MNCLRHTYRIVLLVLSTSLLSIQVTSTQEGSSYFFYQQPEYPRDCKEARVRCLSGNLSGVYTIRPDGYPQPFEVYCDNKFSSGGWTVIQRRIDGSLTFNRHWKDYKSGFGFLASEFWIGNDRLSYLTNQAVYELRVDMMLSNGSSFYVKYSSFRISDEWSQYSLVKVGGFAGNSSCVATTCPSNMIHEGCRCQRVCSDIVDEADCEDDCTETCVFNGCFIAENNTILSNGDTYVNSDCSQRCTCDNNQLDCDFNYRCSLNAACRVQDDVRQCYCNEGFIGDGVICNGTVYTDCFDAYQAGETQDDVYSILPPGWSGSPLNITCNMTIAGGGWTVLQRRVSGSENFEHNWDDYKNGFGTPGEQFWLGNDIMHYLTNQRDYELRMDMINLDGNAYFATYSLFRITSEASNYQLKLGNYDSSSTTGFDAMDYHRDQFFSTPDRDNDGYSGYNCASYRRSAWWYFYYYCKNCDFNSPNFGTSSVPSPYWYSLPGIDELMYTDIKIRPV